MIMAEISQKVSSITVKSQNVVFIVFVQPTHLFLIWFKNVVQCNPAVLTRFLTLVPCDTSSLLLWLSTVLSPITQISASISVSALIPCIIISRSMSLSPYAYSAVCNIVDTIASRLVCSDVCSRSILSLCCKISNTYLLVGKALAPPCGSRLSFRHSGQLTWGISISRKLFETMQTNSMTARKQLWTLFTFVLICFKADRAFSCHP